MQRELQGNRINQQGAFGGGISYDPTTGAQTTTVGQYGKDAAGGLAGLGEQYYRQAGQGVPDYTQGFQQAASFYDANMDPRLERSRAAVESRLRNQGLDPTSAAYKSAMNDLSLQQNEARNNWMASAQNQFFNQGLQNRAQTMNELAPGVNAASTFMTPQVSPYAQINTGGTFDAPGALNANYQAEVNNRNNMFSGFSNLAGIGLKAALGPGGFLV